MAPRYRGPLPPVVWDRFDLCPACERPRGIPCRDQRYQKDAEFDRATPHKDRPVIKRRKREN